MMGPMKEPNYQLIKYIDGKPYVHQVISHTITHVYVKNTITGERYNVANEEFNTKFFMHDMNKPLLYKKSKEEK